MSVRYNQFVAQFVARCGAAKDVCATIGPKGPNFVARSNRPKPVCGAVCGADLWRKGPQPIGPIVARIVARCRNA